MNLRKLYKEIPKSPLAALIFYIVTYILWNINIIPRPVVVLTFLENLYSNVGLIGLFIATFLEGIVYLGLYFPGATIIAISVFLSDGKFITLLIISIVVAITLTITSIINYWLGKHIVSRKLEEDRLLKRSRKATKGLFLSMLHPNSLAFYFFHAGLKKQNLGKILYVPIVMVPYGLAFAFMLSYISSYVKKGVESPYVMISFILIWLIIAYIVGRRKRKKINIVEVNIP